jgi:polyisoprenoid-binding protein YceI
VKSTYFLSLLLALAFTKTVSAQDASSKNFEVNPDKSQVVFTIQASCRKMPGGYTVNGLFSGISGKMNYMENDLQKSKIELAVDVATVKTQGTNHSGCAMVLVGMDSMRDKHLMAPEFFDATQFSQIVFKSLPTQSLQKDASGKFILKGKLVIRGISKTVNFTTSQDPDYVDNSGKRHLVFQAETKLDRTAFGVGPDASEVTDVGTSMISISNELQLNITIDLREVTK